HRPFTPDGPGVNNLRLANGVNTKSVVDRKSLLHTFDSVRRDIDASDTMRGMDTFAARAFDMVASGTVRKALDLTHEDPRVRDHWSPVMSALVAGGGLKMGQAIGASSSRGEHPKDRPLHVPQVLSTLYHTLGIAPGQTFPNGNGRPMYVLDDREPVTELL